MELDTLLLEVLQQMQVLARERLQLRLGDIDQVLVCGDHDRLKQVLVNLVGNAIKYTPAGRRGGGWGWGNASDQARLTVTDTGPGIPAEDMPHIFERFYRGEKSRTAPASMAKAMGWGFRSPIGSCATMAGRSKSTSSGKGTTFCIWLPLAQGDCSESKLAGQQTHSRMLARGY